jgi:V/A-type H+-transporting ATPase subunit I
MLGDFEYVSCLVGSLPEQQAEDAKERVAELGGALETVGKTGHFFACVIICPKESVTEIQKQLRAADFTPVAFEGLSGTAAELIEQERIKLDDIQKELADQNHRIVEFAKEEVKLGILFDHYQNLAFREQARTRAPATEYTVLVEIENKNVVRPFEVITRLYGMPQRIEVDPTVFLAPFFALFFGLCLTDAGYGLVMVALSIYLLKKLQGDKKFAALMLICSISTVVCGALTGGWFGDAVQILGIPALVNARAAILKFGFDPVKNPQTFFRLALGIGYIQLLSGILVAFFYKLRQKRFVDAIGAHLTWFVMLNCFAVALVIVLFSHNEGSIVARLGMGFFNLFSAIFYIGDILSYVRLMALGMVTTGLAVAINQFSVMASEKKYVGPVLALIILLGGHAFNMGISALGAFVHTLRLQYVEFFPKFFQGGGKLFEPFAKQYKHVYINKGHV